MKLFSKTIAILYLIGAVLHLLDLLNFRLQFSEMGTIWRAWIIFLFVFDLIAAIGLWRGLRWGVWAFLTVATAQLIAYIGFRGFFGDQWPLVAFHILSLAGFFGFYCFPKKRRNQG